MADELCGHPIRRRGANKGVTTPCARLLGHKGKHRDQAGIDADTAEFQARYDAMSDIERSEYNRRKNRSRPDRQ